MAGFEEKIYDMWIRRNPKFERSHEEPILKVLSDYGVGANAATTAKGKILGSGYEVYILAFFIGLYSNKKLQLDEDSKVLGQPIQFWGNLDSKKGRKAYPKLREYIFCALVAKSDIKEAMLEVDKGKIVPSNIVNKLIETMEEYANYGFYVIKEKLQNDPAYFFNPRAFYDLIWNLANPSSIEANTNNDELEDW